MRPMRADRRAAAFSWKRADSRSRASALQQNGIMRRSIGLLVLLAPLAFGREVAITFDDLPDFDDDLHSIARQTMITNELVSRIHAEHVPAIGFVNEEKIRDGTLLETWHRAGLELGNHTYAHTELHTAGAGEVTCDIARGSDITSRVIGYSPSWFRPPYRETARPAEQRDAGKGSLAMHGGPSAPVMIDGSDWI